MGCIFVKGMLAVIAATVVVVLLAKAEEGELRVAPVGWSWICSSNRWWHVVSRLLPAAPHRAGDEQQADGEAEEEDDSGAEVSGPRGCMSFSDARFGVHVGPIVHACAGITKK